MHLYLGECQLLRERYAPLLAVDSELLAQAEKMASARQDTFLAGRGLLKHALHEHGLLPPNAPLPPLQLGALGRPYLPPSLQGEHAWDFNLSHSHQLLALCFGRDCVSVDVEVVNPKRWRPALLERVYSAAELEAIAQLRATTNAHPHTDSTTSPTWAVLATKFWSMRESLVKSLGLSVFNSYLYCHPQEQRISLDLRPLAAAAASTASDSRDETAQAWLEAQSRLSSISAEAQIRSLSLRACMELCAVPWTSPTYSDAVLTWLQPTLKESLFLSFNTTQGCTTYELPSDKFAALQTQLQATSYQVVLQA